MILPVANFDTFFGGTLFSKKYLFKILAVTMEWSNAFDIISRYRLTEEYLPYDTGSGASLYGLSHRIPVWILKVFFVYFTP